jgi:hypothetical protein
MNISTIILKIEMNNLQLNKTEIAIFYFLI